MIAGLYPLLQRIEPWDEVRKIITGRMDQVRSSCKIRLEIKCETVQGLQCVAKGKNMVQDVFIVTNQKEELKRKLLALTTA